MCSMWDVAFEHGKRYKVEAMKLKGRVSSGFACRRRQSSFECNAIHIPTCIIFDNKANILSRRRSCIMECGIKVGRLYLYLGELKYGFIG